MEIEKIEHPPIPAVYASTVKGPTPRQQARGRLVWFLTAYTGVCLVVSGLLFAALNGWGF